MTTIVWDGYDLAADRKITSNEIGGVCGYAKKIVALDNGGYIAGSGDYDMITSVSEWLNGRREAPTDDHMKGSCLIYVNPNNEVFCYDSSVQHPSKAFKWEAYGTGAPFAFSALHCGKTAKEAVLIASRIDVHSGGKVDVVHVNPRKDKKVDSTSTTTA